MKRSLSIFVALLLCLSLAAPAVMAEDVCIVAGVAALCGSDWNATDDNNAMTFNGTLYEKTYPNVPAGDYQFKIVHNGAWKGNGEENVLFSVTAACNVKITYDPATGQIKYEGSNVGKTTFTPEAVYVRGAANADAPTWLCGKDWELDEGNRMRLIGEGVYGILYANLPAGTYKFKFATDAAWTHNWGGSEAQCDTDCEAVYNGGDISFQLTEQKDVILKLDLSSFSLENKAAQFRVELAAPGTGVLPESDPNPTDPTQPTDPTEPTDPTDPTQPTEPQNGGEAYYVAGPDSLCGSYWKENDPANQMTKGADGIWTKTYNNVPAGSYAVKITDGTWANSWGGSGQDGNYEFNVATAGKLVIKFDAASKTVTHAIETGSPSPTTPTNTTTPTASGSGQLSNYRVVGNAAWMGSWDPASDLGRMTQIEPGVYQKVFKNVAAGSYEFKITENGSWANTWGDNGGNYKFTLSDKGDVTVTFRYNGTTGTISVSSGTPTETGDFGLMGIAALMLCAATGAALLIIYRKNGTIAQE